MPPKKNSHKKKEKKERKKSKKTFKTKSPNKRSWFIDLPSHCHEKGIIKKIYYSNLDRRNDKGSTALSTRMKEINEIGGMIESKKKIARIRRRKK